MPKIETTRVRYLEHKAENKERHSVQIQRCYEIGRPLYFRVSTSVWDSTPLEFEYEDLFDAEEKFREIALGILA